MRVSDFDFDLPPERIALRPANPRESAKLLVVGEQLSDLTVTDLPSQLKAGDVLVFNNTRVIPAALSGHRVGRMGTKPKIEVLLHQRQGEDTWKAFAKPAKKLEAGDIVTFEPAETPPSVLRAAPPEGERRMEVLDFSLPLRGSWPNGPEGGFSAVVVEKGEAGEVTLRFSVSAAELDAALARVGRVPLPPYIESKRAQDAQDREDYQTSYARYDGAVAAPTAGLHFTQDLMKHLHDMGVAIEFATLHVGAGTFLPVKVEDTDDHKMHSEWGEVSTAVSERLLKAKVEGRRIIAVGTTSLRLLEASGLNPFSGSTNIFITPGYRFRAVDGLITNFHLPKSTLFMLVSAFAGTERMKAAYAHAIAQHYRFYSYGDASLLWPHV